MQKMKTFRCFKLWTFLLFLSFAMISYGQNEVAYNTVICEGNIYNHALSMFLNYKKEYLELSYDTLLIQKYPDVTTRCLSTQIGHTEIFIFDYDGTVHYLKKHGKRNFFKIHPLTYSYKDRLFCVSVECMQFFVKKKNLFQLFKRIKSYSISTSITYKIYYKFEDDYFVFINIEYAH